MRGVVPVLWVLFAATVGTAWGTTAGDDVPEAAALAPVVVDGRTLFRVRGSEAVPASARAEAIAVRIVAIARDPSIAADTIAVEERPLGSN
jgi:hypothetical protein